MKSKELWLSASRVKTWLSCSWKYWTNYKLKLPSESNFGAARGSAVHQLFECLLKKNRRDYVDQIIKDKGIRNIPSIVRFVKWQMERQGFGDEIDNKGQNNFDILDQMIFVGVAYDFFCDKEELMSDYVETLFKLEGESPRYKILGYIDKLSKNKNRLAIRDYKSSSSPFTESELDFEIQAMSYILYCKRVLGMSAFVEFIFLRFPDNPIRKVEVTDSQLDGFEEWLSSIYSHLDDFTEEDAYEHFAYDDGMPKKDEGFKGRLMCGFSQYEGQLKKDGTPMFSCECKWPRDYWVQVVDGEVVKSSDNFEDLEGQIEKRHYEGCPKWRN